MKMDYSDQQKHYGSQRVAELLAIAKTASAIKAAAYISMGCGSGFDFQSVHDNYKCIPMLGFDIRGPHPDNVYCGVKVHVESIFIPNENFTAYAPGQLFTVSVTDKIEEFLKTISGPVLYYTDNGNKKCELHGLLGYLKAGDAIGTHDWGDLPTGLTVMGNRAEVDEKDCSFIYEAGLRTADLMQPWLTENRCMQKFWIKN